MPYIFLSYAREDQEHANIVWHLLTNQGFMVWMDRERLLPGQRWDPTIRRAIAISVGAVFLASRHSLEKDSYIQEELDALLQRAESTPEDQIYLIIIRLDDVQIVDERLKPFHWVGLLGKNLSGSPELRQVFEAAWSAEAEIERRNDLEEDSAENHKEGPKQTSYKPTRGTTGVLFLPKDLDIYVNKVNKDAFIFHGPVISYAISRLVYVPENHALIVVMNDGTRFDLGVKIQWLIRSHFLRAKEVRIMRTNNGKKQEEVTVPLRLGVWGTWGTRAWPNRRGMRPIALASYRARDLLFRDQREKDQRRRDKDRPDRELKQATVLANWFRWILWGCLVLCILALVGVGVIIGKLLG